ncbi:hypothetical protein [Streptomyces sp. NPDC012888]|uniref:hypothetical protein n=1 Tax=Streptomyces sp. NPDC012888 TaxID=3364855 RepID=UPI0036974449
MADHTAGVGSRRPGGQVDVLARPVECAGTRGATGSGRRFHVTTTFRSGGPVAEGIWQSESAALTRFRGFIGSYATTRGGAVSLTLWAETDGEPRPLRTWSTDRGEEIHPVH